MKPSAAQPARARHFSTIGIEDVFLDPPKPSHLFPRSYLLNGETTGQFVSWEIVGTVKNSPKDFIVREIAKDDRQIPGELNDNERSAFGVADIVVCRPLHVQDESQQDQESDAKEQQRKENKDEHQAKAQANPTGDDQVALGSRSQNGKVSEDTTKSAEFEPLELVETVLMELVENHDACQVKDLISRIKSLDKAALEGIKSWNGEEDETKQGENDDEDVQHQTIELPSAPPKISIQMDNAGIEIERKEFYRALRLAFPLLRSISVPERNNNIQISMDDFFHELIPYLYRPHEDLPALYLFTKKGCADVISKPSNFRGKGPDRKRKRGQPDRSTPELNKEGNDNAVFLRLLPDLPKDQRRPVHQIISKKNRDFNTSTIQVPLEKESQANTAAIVVHWSPKAMKKTRNKQKAESSGKTNPYPNTLCVLKKRGKEHLTAINHMCRVLKCRPHEVGTAGIKDMKAVTYQFCTLRNIGPGRILKSIPTLKSKGIELGTIRRVDFFLQNGELQGNRFEIVIRDLRRVVVTPNSSGGAATEQFVPCEKKHIEILFERVRRTGFVNYYGEQRVGNPGSEEEVGVRSFDIGKAMLQENFSKAIDLIMAGRSVNHRNDATKNPQETLMRKTWKESGGNPEATLKVFPKGEAMAREQAILKGLKRFGKDKPLDAIQCVAANVRRLWINGYQSYVWNKMASARLMKYGSACAVIGDLYMEEGAQQSQNVKVVDENNLSSVKIEQVVLPLPGYRIQYPSNAIGNLYQKQLEEDSVQFDKKSPDEATAKGAYRHLIVTPQNMELAFEESVSSGDESASSMTLKFDLIAGSYATMLLRELMLTTVARND